MVEFWLFDVIAARLSLNGLPRFAVLTGGGANTSGVVLQILLLVLDGVMIVVAHCVVCRLVEEFP